MPHHSISACDWKKIRLFKILEKHKVGEMAHSNWKTQLHGESQTCLMQSFEFMQNHIGPYSSKEGLLISLHAYIERRYYQHLLTVGVPFGRGIPFYPSTWLGLILGFWSQMESNSLEILNFVFFLWAAKNENSNVYEHQIAFSITKIELKKAATSIPNHQSCNSNPIKSKV